jgi:hypothetical protein
MVFDNIRINLKLLYELIQLFPAPVPIAHYFSIIFILIERQNKWGKLNWQLCTPVRLLLAHFHVFLNTLFQSTIPTRQTITSIAILSPPNNTVIHTEYIPNLTKLATRPAIKIKIQNMTFFLSIKNSHVTDRNPVQRQDVSFLNGLRIFVN